MLESKDYVVYVLKSARHNYHYIGHTKNLKQRLKVHNAGKVRSTKAYRPFTVIYQEIHSTKSAAYQREMYYKSGKGNQALRTELQQRGVW